MIIISIFHEDSFMKFVDRFIVMDRGRIIYDGFPLDKKKNSMVEYKRC